MKFPKTRTFSSILYSVLVFLPLGCWSQNITLIEYYFDTDPGYHNGTIVNINTPTTDTVNLALNINTSGLTSGSHDLFIRSLDEEGRWSLTQKQSLIIDLSPPLSDVIAMEYYYDTDPGYGNGTSISVTPDNPIEDLIPIISTSGLSIGPHTLCIRSKDLFGQWSSTNCTSVFKSKETLLTDIVELEYYFDNDPGLGAGTSLSVTAATDIINLNASITTGGLNNGIHHLCIRAIDGNGQWSSTHCEPVLKRESPTVLDIVDAEYYFDNDPGLGQGISLSIPSSSDIMDAIAPLSSNGLSLGYHSIFIRVKDENGKWSLTDQKTIYIIESTLGDISKIEYFIDNDPGIGQANPISITPGKDKANIMITLSPSISDGIHQLGIRSADTNNVWSHTNMHLIMKKGLDPNNKIDSAEYFIDSDPGYGNGAPIAIPDGKAIESIMIGIDLNGIQDGMHHLFLRTKDSINHWSLDNITSFMKWSPNGQTIVNGEYYIDNDPGLNNGTPITVSSGSDINVLGAIDVTGLSQGMHSLYSRFQDDSMVWSLTQVDLFMLKEETIVPIDGGEYFFDVEPGLDNGIGFALPPDADLNNATIVVLADTLSIGLHDFYIRTHTQANEWSHTNIVLDVDRNAALPVDWLAFSVQKEGEDAWLDWSIANAINASHFEIERLSPTSKTFDFLERIEMKEGVYGYELIDEKPGRGKYYYRIKQVDLDGQFEYSPSRSVDFDSDIEWSVYPNPTVSTITIEGISSSAQLKMYNGQNQLLNPFISNRTDTLMTLNLEQLSPGPYFILIQEGIDTKTIMVIKQ